MRVKKDNNLVKKIFLIVSACASMIIVLLCCFQHEFEQEIFPFETSYSANVSFNGTAVKPEVLIDGFNGELSEKNATALLERYDNDDPDHGKVFYRFGKQHSEESPDRVWISHDSYGTIRPAEKGSLDSLNGNCMFYSNKDLNTFKNIAQEYGGTVTGVQHKETGKYVININAHPLFKIVAFLLFGFVTAVVWAWAGLRVHSQNIRLMNGKSHWNISLQDIKDYCRLCLPTALASLVLSLAAGMFWWHIPFGSFVVTVACTSIVFFGVSVLCAGLVSLILSPKVKNVAARDNNEYMVRWGSTVIKVVCLAAVFAVMPQTVDQGLTAVKDLKSVTPWEKIGNALTVNADTMVIADENAHMLDGKAERERWEKPFEKFFEIMSAQEGMHMSYKLNTRIAPYDPSRSDSSENVIPELTNGKYTDVVIANRSFMSLFNIDQSRLRHIDSSDLVPQFRDRVNKAAVRLKDGVSEDNVSGACYEWDSDESFPALPGSSNSPRIEYSSKPLVILFDDLSEEINTYWQMTEAESGRIFFTDKQATVKAAEESGILPSVTAFEPMTDRVMSIAENCRQTCYLQLFCASLALLIVALCVVQTAKIWALARKKKIFVLRTAGLSWVNIMRWRAVACFVISAILIFVGTASRTSGQSLSQNAGLLLILSMTAAYLAAEFLCGCSACRDVFVAAVHRQ